MVLAERYAAWAEETKSLCDVGQRATELIQSAYAAGREAALSDPDSPEAVELRQRLAERARFWAGRDLVSRAREWAVEVDAAIGSAERAADRLGLFREWAWLVHSTLPLLEAARHCHVGGARHALEQHQETLTDLASRAEDAFRALPRATSPAFHRAGSYESSEAFVRRHQKKLFGAIYRLERGDGVPPAHVELVETWLLPTGEITLCVPISVGCPNRCTMCEFGTYWGGDLSGTEILRLIEINLAHDRGAPLEVRPERLTIYYLGGGDPCLHREVPSLISRVAAAFPGVRQILSTIAIDSGEALSTLVDAAIATPDVGLQISLCSLDEASRRRWTGGVKLVPASECARELERFAQQTGRKGYVSLFLSSDEAPEQIAERARAQLDPARTHLTLTVLRENQLAGSRGATDWQHYRAAHQALERAGFECSISTNDLDPDNEVACGRSDPRTHLGNHPFRKVGALWTS